MIPTTVQGMVPLGPAEDIQSFFAQGIEGMATYAWQTLAGAFSSTDMNASWWVTVVGGTVRTHVGGATTEVVHPGMLNLLVQVMAPVLVILAVVQVVISVFRQSTLGMIRAVAAAIYAIPLTYVVAGIMYLLITVGDNVTVMILQAGTGGEDEAVGTIMGLFGLSWDPTANKVLLDENYQQWAMAKDQGNPGAVMLPALMVLLVWIMAFILTGFMVFRLMALIVLASLTPVAVMSQPLGAAKGLMSGFASTSAALLLSKPLAALILKIGMLVSTTSTSQWQFVAGLIAMGMAAVMPLASMKFASFLTGSAGDGIIGGGSGLAQSGGRRLERHGGGAVRGATRTASKVIRAPARLLRR
ncbi:hypothetical protein [Paenarthrobacter sp. C1]|uniref:hypothetical protein n=1 Tax=Paenarthrobacter sp. C1 TaxID=3400220 RepID=UPI003BF5E949